MTEHGRRFELPGDVDHYLAALSKLYARNGERQKQEIVVNAQVRVHEEWTYDNWDGGRFGHALYLTVPESLYLKVVDAKNDLQEAIRSDLNKIHNVRNEFIAEVFLEMEKSTDHDWRRDSGLLLPGERIVTSDTNLRIWGEKGFRVFLSHKAEVKKEAAELKNSLAVFGISAFVAHADIRPTKEWQNEIENALASMDAFIALLTDDFHDSDWTDQEVGYALARGVQMIAVKLGRDPYGFIGKFQALKSSWNGAPFKLVKLLIGHPRMLEAYLQAVADCQSFDHGNTLSKILPALEALTEGQAEQLRSAFNENHQLQGSFGFAGNWPSKFGPCLAAHI